MFPQNNNETTFNCFSTRVKITHFFKIVSPPVSATALFMQNKYQIYAD